jgi:hypothetical protein
MQEHWLLYGSEEFELLILESLEYPRFKGLTASHCQQLRFLWDKAVSTMEKFWILKLQPEYNTNGKGISGISKSGWIKPTAVPSTTGEVDCQLLYARFLILRQQ